MALQIFTFSGLSQAVEVRIVADADARTATVTGQFSGGFRPFSNLNVSFKREVVGAPSLASRVTALELSDSAGKPVDFRRLTDGEYVAAREYRSFKYVVDLGAPEDLSGYAHASWINSTNGVLMLDDLLPQYGARTERLSGTLDVKLPEGWRIYSSDPLDLKSSDLSKTVLFVGKGYRMVDTRSAYGDLRVLVDGEWHFTDDEASRMAVEIFDAYSKMLGRLPAHAYLVALQRFPVKEQLPGRWEAETRGRTVTIFSSDMPFRTQSLQRLHEQLRHEIFHLWFPNGVDLTGDYAWFYEGFAMYLSLKLAVRLNRIRFDDFLDTLGRAHTVDSNYRPRKALTDPTVDHTVRYARGMIVAFLTDLQLIGNSRGKDDVGTSLRTLFQNHVTTPHRSDARTAVRTVVGDSNMIRLYVEGSEVVEWADYLAQAGIVVSRTGRSTELIVVDSLSSSQKRILNRLGYNSWRSLGKKK